MDLGYGLEEEACLIVQQLDEEEEEEAVAAPAPASPSSSPCHVPTPSDAPFIDSDDGLDEEAYLIALQLEEEVAAAAAATDPVPAAARDDIGTASKRKRIENMDSEAIVFNPSDVVADPDIWRQIEEYATQKIRDTMRRAYLSKGPCRLIGDDFP